MTPLQLRDLPLTPTSIRTYLDMFVIGQEDAKDALSAAGFLHYLRFLYHVDTRETIKHTNILLMGPSGSGKTLLLKHLAEYFQFPFLNVSALEINRVGWSGESLNEKIGNLVANPAHPSDLAKFAIIFIDEIDKLGSRAESTNSSDHNADIQATLLKLIEGDALMPVGHKSISTKPDITTHNMLFVFAGAFNKVAAKRQAADKHIIGFGSTDTDFRNSVTLQNEAIEAGLIPELMGRIGTIIELQALTRSQLKQVLLEAKGNILAETQKLLAFVGQTLEVSDETIEGIIDSALLNETGARSLDVALQAFITEAIKNIGLPQVLLTQEETP